MLQAYALQSYLKSLDHKVETINLRNDRQRKMYNYPLYPPLQNRKRYLFSLLNPFWMRREIKKWHLYETFMHDNLCLTKKEYHNWEEIVEDLPQLKYDILITGGDQIWNMRCKDFDKSYFLPDKLEGIKKVSYSPSFGRFGLSKTSAEERKKIITYLSDYSLLSVREESMQTYLSKRLDMKIEITADPTLLLKQSDYLHIIDEKPIIEGEYIYYYSPFYRPHAERLARRLGRHYGIKVVTSFPHLFHNKEYSVQESGPSEFLNLLKNATLVVGKSFHLVVFSLLFHKNFIAVDGDTDARMKYILKLTRTEERGLINENNFERISLPQIDFEYAEEKLKELCLSSVSFLQNATNQNVIW